ncbi:hypothetical protein [Variovorax sp. JS1663]|uniref:hypothetical protein n=1 Tax=Variovorax sp. JS1663 TaxID=1851577 RepID=UPI00117F0CD2|nr:hypothetical protein [Variovorax sp. JS1663]
MKNTTIISWCVPLQLALVLATSSCANAPLPADPVVPQGVAQGRDLSKREPLPSSLPYRPKDGDKLGYSKEESTRRLSPEVRAILDGILRLYEEPGLFADRRRVFAVLGTEPGRREILPHPIPRTSATDKFRVYAAPQGVFAEGGVSAEYLYDGQESRNSEMTWRGLLTVRFPYKQKCVDSRAVEGYLDLYLYAGIDGLAHPLLPSQWDRHDFGGRPFALALSKTTPSLSLNFVGGCVALIYVGDRFNYRDLADDHLLN